MFRRYFIATTSGTAVTAALLFVMQLLISIQPTAASQTTTPIDLVFNRVIDELPPPPLPKPIERKHLTNAPLPPISARPTHSGPTLSVYAPNKTLGPSFKKIDALQTVDGPLVAMIRVQPSYPASAQARGLEGYAVVEFDVLENGQTANVRVIESSDRLFEKPAIRAAQRFKFKPRVVDGQPIQSHGIQNVFRFEMNKD